MVDGIRFNNSTFRFGPNQYLNTIDAYTVAKIEVARGTGSVQYGSDALGGVIQVFTKEPAFNTNKALHVAAIGKAVSSDMEYTGRAELQYQSKKLAILAGITSRKFGDLIGGDTTGKQSPSGYKEQSFDVKLKWKIADRSTLTLSHQFLQQNDVPLYHRVQLENFAYYFFAPQQRQMTYAKLQISGRNKWLDKITFIGSLQQSFEKRTYQKNGNANKFSEEDKVKTVGLTADILSNITPNWTANSGLEYYHDKVNSSKQQTAIASNVTLNHRWLYPNNASSGNFSLYSLHHVKINRFEVEAGLRYNSFAITIPDTVTSSLKLGDVTVKPASLVANTALLFHLNKQQSVYTSFSTGYRTPNIDDMGTLGLVDFRYEIPAYNLKPEKTYNTELGYRFSNKKIQASVAIFYMQLTNLITRVQVAGEQVGGYNVYTKENSQESFLRGAEFSFDYEFTSCFLLKSGASYAYGQNTSRNEPMRRIPPFNGRVLLEYHKAKWQACFENLFAGKQGRLAQGDKDDNRIAKGGTAGWDIINLYGGYVADKYAIRIGLQNLLDKDYRTHGSGINAIGRSGWLALQVNF
jgi:outer membrane receptor protein involved in Fe transport